MKDEHNLMMMYNMLDFKIVNEVHRDIQNLLKHQILLDNRKKKINKLKEKLWIQNGM